MTNPAKDHVDRQQQIAEDERLVREVVAGSLDAWHKFLEDYSGLIQTIVRRHLPAEDREDIRSVFVDILEVLYKGGLARYRGRVPLAVWLTIFVRRRSIDVLRARYGRRRSPKGLENLSVFDRRVFQLYYVEHLGLEVVTHLLERDGKSASSEAIVESIVRIGECVDARCLRRLDDEHGARMNGGSPTRLLKYLVDLRVQYERQACDHVPDRDVMEREARRAAEQIRALIATLPKKDQKIVELRFERGMGAREISDELDLGGQRKAFTIIDRIVRRLRTALNGGAGAR